MNTIVRLGKASGFILGLVLGPGLAGCGQRSWDDGSGFVCQDFVVGEDMTRVDWELEGQDNVDFGTAMQAVSDLSIAAGAMVSDLGVACRGLAIDLGEPVDSVDERTITDPANRTAAWCTIAASGVKKVAALGSLTLSAQAPRCLFSAVSQATCEAECMANDGCEAELGDVAARCESDEVWGQCDGLCSGRCAGSANLAVACSGNCLGKCSGTCSGACSAIDGAGGCEGICEGICEGECEGTCDVAVGASVQCAGSCSGGCDGELKAPKCEDELAPPSTECSGSAACNRSCQASASARAECAPPVLAFGMEGALDVEMARKLAALAVWLPEIDLIGRVRGQLLSDNAHALYDAAHEFLVMSGESSAVRCIIDAVQTLGSAVINADASVAASFEVGMALSGSLR